MAYLCLRLALCLTNVLCFHCVVPALSANFQFPARCGYSKICSSKNLFFMKTVFSALFCHTCVLRLENIFWVRIWLWLTTGLIGEKISVKSLFRHCSLKVKPSPSALETTLGPAPYTLATYSAIPQSPPLTHIGLAPVIPDFGLFDWPLLCTSVYLQIHW